MPSPEDWSQLLDDDASPRRVELRRLADAAREVIERLVATTAPPEVLAEAADALEDVARRFAAYPHGAAYEGYAEAANAGGDPHPFFDHSPLIGAANPLAPPLRVEVAGDRVHASVVFGSAYEGPPGHVHGGFIAAAFDEVLGVAQSLSGSPGMTGTLRVRYRRPTPLHAELRFDAGIDRVEGRKILVSGRLHHDGQVTAEADGLFVSVDFSRLAELKARRDGLR